MSRRSLAIWVLGLVSLAGLALALPVPPAEAVPTATVVNVKATLQGTNYVLQVTGNAPPGGAWLGRSVYPYGITNKATQGLHEVVQVGAGTFSRTFTVPVNLVRGGSYEIALWATRVPSSQCKIASDPWCKRNGFHLSGLLTYKGGWMPRTVATP